MQNRQNILWWFELDSSFQIPKASFDPFTLYSGFYLFIIIIVGGTNLFPIKYFSLWQWAEEADATRTNLFNPKSERDLPPATYKHKLTSRVYPKRTIPDWGWVHPTCELMLISCGWEASLPDVGFSKFVRVASVSSAHSQSEQYLIGERFVPPTIHTHTHTHTHIYIYIYAHYSKMTTEVRLFKYFKS